MIPFFKKLPDLWERQKLSVQAKRPGRNFPWGNSLSCTPGASSWELVGYANLGPHPDSWIRNSWGGAVNLCLNKPAHSSALRKCENRSSRRLGAVVGGAKGAQSSRFSEEPQELANESAKEFNMQDMPGQRTHTVCPLPLPESWVPFHLRLVILKW